MLKNESEANIVEERSVEGWRSGLKEPDEVALELRPNESEQGTVRLSKAL
jgi:hypothetical protein